MPTIERTPAESVARCNTLGAQHATPAQRAQHPAQQGAQHSPAPDVKTLAKHALARIEERNGARNIERNAAVGGCCIGNEGAQQPAAQVRTEFSRTIKGADRARCDGPWWRELFEERAAIREHDGGMSRAEAEAGALDDLARRWRALHPVASSSDATCVHCGKPEPDLPVLARDGRAWLHRQCWPALDATRQAQAVRAVRDLLGIAR